MNDALTEDVEVFSVAMSSASEFVLVENNIAIVQIIDEDGMHREWDFITGCVW